MKGVVELTPGGLEAAKPPEPSFTYLVSPMAEKFSPRARDQDRQLVSGDSVALPIQEGHQAHSRYSKEAQGSLQD